MHCSLCGPLTKSLESFHIREFDNAPLDSHIWLFDYGDISEVLRRAKYSRESIHYSHLARYLANAIRSSSDASAHTLITYVPTIPSHLRSRGKDHAQILATAVARYLGNFAPLLIPTHDKPQVSAGVNIRHRNPHYVAISSMKGADVVIIDDVATTRTTLIRAAESLRSHGAGRVIGATLAYRS